MGSHSGTIENISSVLRRGELLNFVGIQTDITERKRAEEERDRFTIDRSAAGLDGYFKRLPDPAWEKRFCIRTRNFWSNHS